MLFRFFIPLFVSLRLLSIDSLIKAISNIFIPLEPLLLTEIGTSFAGVPSGISLGIR